MELGILFGDTNETRNVPNDLEIYNARIYVNEDLTGRRATLLWKARTQKKAQLIQDCWSYDGRVMIENAYNRIYVIENENELMDKINT